MLQIKVDTDRKGKRLITTSLIKEDEVFHKLTDYQLIASPTYTSVQISQDINIEELYLAHLNHSCHPNVYVDTSKLELRALQDIQSGDELTFFYPSTEWNMSTPFACACDSMQCLRKIAGAKYLSLDVLSKYCVNRHIGIMALECLTKLGHDEVIKFVPKDRLGNDHSHQSHMAIE